MVCLLLAAACTPRSTGTVQGTAGTQPPPPPPIVTSSGASLQRVAVIVIPDKGFNSVRAENIALEDLSRKGYLLASRSDIDMILREQKLQYNQLMEKDFRVKLAELLNVQAMFVIEATSIYRGYDQGKEYFDVRGIAARLIDAQHGTVLWIKNIERPADGLAANLLLLPVQILAGPNVGRGDVVGDVLKEFPPCAAKS
jgi:hypothetical protein